MKGNRQPGRGSLLRLIPQSFQKDSSWLLEHLSLLKDHIKWMKLLVIGMQEIYSAPMGQDPSCFILHLHDHWLSSVNSQKAMETLRWNQLQPSIQNWWFVNKQAQVCSPSPPPLNTRMQSLTIAAQELNLGKLELPPMKSRFSEECMLWLQGRSWEVLVRGRVLGAPSVLITNL